MRVFARVLAVLACLVLAAHFLRRAAGSGDPLSWLGVVLCLALPFLLLVRAPWGVAALRAALAVGTVVWILAALALARERREAGLPWKRGAGILAGVAVATAAAALLLRGRRSAG